ncbi:autotransporter outer membrane beta-barrel domain-containing protein [Pseudomonas kermanshahensis]|uniref:autotransporter outer membrane beta-barrel domain-containing protein n=1 Tax=Pseudomonas kermanshahensis TaxID=2745482 RepID=UPI0023DB8668|nr:autotransporter outer membrane beta-barrel domain-containing protein [Pseudomonas kermanshahensis]WEL56970.1 autotransporter outer membrane beta-barrel domain-containing protein [Pseudomonas kermanshahensis]
MPSRPPFPARRRSPAAGFMLFGPLLFATSAWGETLISDDTQLDAGSTLDSYRVIGPATLTAEGATTLQIAAEAGSTVNLSDSQVTAETNANGLSLRSASATVQRTTISSNTRGLGLSNGSTAVISDSVVEGGVQGAIINASTAELQRSALRGTDATSEGVRMVAGTLTAKEGSTLSGGSYGARILEDNGRGSTLVVDNSLVEGRNGPAIMVGRGAGFAASAQIDVLNGATLSSGNGVLLEVADDASANLRVNDSHLHGDIVAATGGTANVLLENRATLTGRLDNVASLGINSGAEWVLIENSHTRDLTLNEGAVRFGGPGDFFTLSVDKLAGNGTFIMEADFSTAQSDFLEVTGTASGTHQLLISPSGNDPLADNSLRVVHIAAGDAQFSLAGGAVDLGAYSYDLVQRDSNDWYLDVTTRTISPGTQSVMALANVAPTIWYGELGTLRSRMGEVRRDPRKAGGWVRTYANQYNVSGTSGAAYQQQQQGLSIGTDTPVAAGDGNWLVGVTAGYSNSDLNLTRGSSASVDSYHAGAYTTWLDPDSGYYFDAVARLNRFKNQADVRMSDDSKAKGDYAALGAGVSLEVGRQLALADGWFVEPFAQLSGLVVQGKDYTLDNGMRAESERTRSVLGKVGSTVGRTFTAGEGRSVQPYLRVAAVHEFVNDNQVKVNDNRFGTDLSGSRGEVGVGMAVAWDDKWQAHADFDYSNGSKIEQPWGVNFGVRYNW